MSDVNETMIANLEKLGEWKKAEAALEAAKALEIKLRKELFTAFVPTPKEGTNTVELPAGWVLKATYKLNRKLDESMLATVRELLEGEGVYLDKIVKMKPELSIKEYKALPSASRKILDEAITATPGTPGLELIEPKAE